MRPIVELYVEFTVQEKETVYSGGNIEGDEIILQIFARDIETDIGAITRGQRAARVNDSRETSTRAYVCIYIFVDFTLRPPVNPSHPFPPSRFPHVAADSFAR